MIEGGWGEGSCETGVDYRRLLAQWAHDIRSDVGPLGQEDRRCEYTNHVTACATEPFLAFIEERGSSGSHDTDAFRAFLGKEESSRSSRANPIA